MEINLYNTAEFIKVNKLEEVTDPMLFDKGMPSSLGLLSTDIFGTTSKERKTTYAYINLNGYFLHPFIYKLLKRINRNFESIVHSTKKFVIKDGELIRDEENGETGLTWLYNNWEKLNFTKNNSLMRNERVDVLSAYKKDVIFTKYWIVMPAFYRDVNLQAVGKGEILKPHEINTLYSKLIRYAAMIKNENNFSFVLDNTRTNLQLTLVEIYDEIKSKIEKKHGLIRKNLLGKSIDSGARMVISAPIYHANKPEDTIVDFYHTGIPLAYCCGLFMPFLIPWLRNYFKQKLMDYEHKFPVKDGGYIELESPELYYNDEYLRKQVNSFIYSVNNRFENIKVPTKNTNKDYYFMFTARVYDEEHPISESPMIERYATWCDVLYQAMVEITADKMVYLTRYPITDYFGSFPTQITVLSTQRTVPFYVDGKVYKHYPDIQYYQGSNKESTAFIDTVKFSNLYCGAAGADYDGDQITVKALYTQEANAEALAQLKSKKNILNITGGNMRTSSNEVIQTLYALTK